MFINEIFYSLQGEGFFTGTPAIFLRFAGCNLHCPFCDTQHHSSHSMTEEEIVKAVSSYPARHVVITGGEPSLQVIPSLIDKLHQAGKFIAIETNGTHSLPANIDWVTLSPKDRFVKGGDIVLKKCHELKVVFQNNEVEPPTYPFITALHRFMQPCDTGNPDLNAHTLRSCLSWILKHPEWRLSLQTHKMLGIR